MTDYTQLIHASAHMARFCNALDPALYRKLDVKWGLCDISGNIDFYSGFVYRMLNLPPELYTPLFAVARIVGWSAHRLEEINNAGKIIRPAYKAIKERVPYEKMDRRWFFSLQHSYFVVW